MRGIKHPGNIFSELNITHKHTLVNNNFRSYSIDNQIKVFKNKLKDTNLKQNIVQQSINIFYCKQMYEPLKILFTCLPKQTCKTLNITSQIKIRQRHNTIYTSIVTNIISKTDKPLKRSYYRENYLNTDTQLLAHMKKNNCRLHNNSVKT